MTTSRQAAVLETPVSVTLADSMRKHISLPTAAGLLFISGLASLAYQLLWIKQLSLIVGVEVYAVTIAVSAFFGGLALGSYLFGHWIERLVQDSYSPVRVYALLECGIAALAVTTTYALGAAPEIFVLLENQLGVAAWLLPMLLVALPATLMGGTLPVMMKSLTAHKHNVGTNGGGLYAANTAGAIVGALAAPLALIPAFGVHGAALAAAALNLLGGIFAILLLRTPTAKPASPLSIKPIKPSSQNPIANHGQGAKTALLLYALAGGVALGYEVIWSQLIVQFMSTRSFAFAIVLATYLLGLVLGSALYSRRADRIGDPWGIFGILLTAAGLIALLEVTLLGGWLVHLQTQAEALVQSSTNNLQAAMGTRFAVAALCIVFIPTLLLGAAFPLALRLSVDAGHAGRDLGKVVALNTLGGILGTLVCGFVLIPWLGLVHSLAALALMASAIGLVAVFRGAGHPKVSSVGARYTVAIMAGLVLIATVFTPANRLASLQNKVRGGALVAYEESRGGTVAVVEQKRGENTFRRLYINGVSNSGDTMTSLRYMRLQALLPLLIHKGEPKSALVIGLGTGITSGALLRYPGLEQRVVAELVPAVVRAVPQFRGNYSVTSDPRMDIRQRDGRRELMSNTQAYDLITLEPPPPSAAGVVNLYSSDFYQLAAKRLQPGGMVAQWLPLPTQNDGDTRSLARSFLDIFPYVSLWTTELHEMMLVGSLDPIELDVARISQRFHQPEVAQTLGEVGINSPAALLATWITDRTGLERYVANAPAVTDDRPRIEYAPWVKPGEVRYTLPHLLDTYSAPPLQGADTAFNAELEAERQTLMHFYSSGIAAYKGDRQAWADNLRYVIAADGNNPYYNWFTGGAAE